MISCTSQYMKFHSPSNSCTEASNLYLHQLQIKWICHTFINQSTLLFKIRNLQRPIFSPCKISLHLFFELNRSSLYVSLFPVFEHFLHICILKNISLFLLWHSCGPTTLKHKLTLPLQSFPLHYPAHQITKSKRPHGTGPNLKREAKKG